MSQDIDWFLMAGVSVDAIIAELRVWPTEPVHGAQPSVHLRQIPRSLLTTGPFFDPLCFLPARSIYVTRKNVRTSKTLNYDRNEFMQMNSENVSK